MGAIDKIMIGDNFTTLPISHIWENKSWGKGKKAAYIRAGELLDAVTVPTTILHPISLATKIARSKTPRTKHDRLFNYGQGIFIKNERYVFANTDGMTTTVKIKPRVIQNTCDKRVSVLAMPTAAAHRLAFKKIPYNSPHGLLSSTGSDSHGLATLLLATAHDLDITHLQELDHHLPFDAPLGGLPRNHKTRDLPYTPYDRTMLYTTRQLLNVDGKSFDTSVSAYEVMTLAIIEYRRDKSNWVTPSLTLANCNDAILEQVLSSLPSELRDDGIRLTAGLKMLGHSNGSFRQTHATARGGERLIVGSKTGQVSSGRWNTDTDNSRIMAGRALEALPLDAREGARHLNKSDDHNYSLANHTDITFLRKSFIQLGMDVTIEECPTVAHFSHCSAHVIPAIVNGNEVFLTAPDTVKIATLPHCYKKLNHTGVMAREDLKALIATLEVGSFDHNEKTQLYDTLTSNTRGITWYDYMTKVFEGWLTNYGHVPIINDFARVGLAQLLPLKPKNVFHDSEIFIKGEIATEHPDAVLWESTRDGVSETDYNELRRAINAHQFVIVDNGTPYFQAFDHPLLNDKIRSKWGPDPPVAPTSTLKFEKPLVLLGSYSSRAHIKMRSLLSGDHKRVLLLGGKGGGMAQVLGDTLVRSIDYLTKVHSTYTSHVFNFDGRIELDEISSYNNTGLLDAQFIMNIVYDDFENKKLADNEFASLVSSENADLVFSDMCTDPSSPYYEFDHVSLLAAPLAIAWGSQCDVTVKFMGLDAPLTRSTIQLYTQFYRSVQLVKVPGMKSNSREWYLKATGVKKLPDLGKPYGSVVMTNTTTDSYMTYFDHYQPQQPTAQMTHSKQLRLAKRFLRRHVHGNVLDFGAGKGGSLHLYSDLATSITVIEPNTNSYNYYKITAPAHRRIHHIAGNYDTILADNSIQQAYVTNPSVLDDLLDVLKIGGKLILVFPDLNKQESFGFTVTPIGMFAIVHLYQRFKIDGKWTRKLVLDVKEVDMREAYPGLRSKALGKTPLLATLRYVVITKKSSSTIHQQPTLTQGLRIGDLVGSHRVGNTNRLAPVLSPAIPQNITTAKMPRNRRSVPVNHENQFHELHKTFAASAYGMQGGTMLNSGRSDTRQATYHSAIDIPVTGSNVFVLSPVSAVGYIFDITTEPLKFRGVTDTDEVLTEASGVKAFAPLGAKVTLLNEANGDAMNGKFVTGIARELPDLVEFNESNLVRSMPGATWQRPSVASSHTAYAPSSQTGAWMSKDIERLAHVPSQSPYRYEESLPIGQDLTRSNTNNATPYQSDGATLYQTWQGLNTSPRDAYTTSVIPWTVGELNVNVNWNVTFASVEVHGAIILDVFTDEDGTVTHTAEPIGNVISAVTGYMTSCGSAQVDLRSMVATHNSGASIYAPIIGFRVRLETSSFSHSAGALYDTALNDDYENIVNVRVTSATFYEFQRNAFLALIDGSAGQPWSISFDRAMAYIPTESQSRLLGPPGSMLTTQRTNEMSDVINSAIQTHPNELSAGTIGLTSDPSGAFSFRDLARKALKVVKGISKVTGKIANFGDAFTNAAEEEVKAQPLTRRNSSPPQAGPKLHRYEIRTPTGYMIHNSAARQKRFASDVVELGQHPLVSNVITRKGLLTHAECYMTPEGKRYKYSYPSQAAGLGVGVRDDYTDLLGWKFGPRLDSDKPITLFGVRLTLGQRVGQTDTAIAPSKGMYEAVKTLNELYEHRPDLFTEIRPANSLLLYSPTSVEGSSVTAPLFTFLTKGDKKVAATGVAGFRKGRVDEAGLPLPMLGLARLTQKQSIKTLKGVNRVVAVTKQTVSGVTSVQDYAGLWKATHVGQRLPSSLPSRASSSRVKSGRGRESSHQNRTPVKV